MLNTVNIILCSTAFASSTLSLAKHRASSHLFVLKNLKDLKNPKDLKKLLRVYHAVFDRTL